MATPSFVDFAAIKEAVSIEEGIAFLGLKMKREGEQFRSPCPVCKKGGDRALVVTPSKGFYCFGAKKGGDIIAFVAHIKDCGQREAGSMLQEQYCTDTSTSTRNSTSSDNTRSKAAPPTNGGLEPLAYLSTEHPVIEALKLSETVCQALGIGYAPKGKMRGRIAFPLRLPDGTLVGYLGLATTAEMTPLILLPENLEERIAPPTKEEKPKPADDVRNFLRLAVNNG